MTIDCEQGAIVLAPGMALAVVVGLHPLQFVPASIRRTRVGGGVFAAGLAPAI